MVKEIQWIVSYDRIYIVDIKIEKFGPTDVYYFFPTYCLLSLLALGLLPTYHVDLNSWPQLI